MLKSLDLTRCYGISKGGFANAIKKLPLLEELELYHCLHDEEVLVLVAKMYRCLKRFSLVQKRRHSCPAKGRTDDRKAFAITRMYGLRSLELVGDNLSNEGLTSIIDSCRHLQYLNISDCCNINMNGNLTEKCAAITMDYCEYIPLSGPCPCRFSSFYWDLRDFSPIYSDFGGDYDSNDYHDLSLYSYLGDEIDGADFEEHERILDVKSMRRYLS
jgi:hypothetical protein